MLPLSTVVIEIHTDPHNNHIIIREYLSSLPHGSAVVTDATVEIDTLNHKVAMYQTYRKGRHGNKLRVEYNLAKLRLRTLYNTLRDDYQCGLLPDGRLGGPWIPWNMAGRRNLSKK